MSSTSGRTVAAMALAAVVGISAGVAVSTLGAGASSTAEPTGTPSGQWTGSLQTDRWQAAADSYATRWGRALYEGALAGDPELATCYETVRDAADR